MFRVLTRLFKQLLPKRKKSASPSSVPKAATPPQAQPPPVSEEEVRKRLEGLGYIE